MRTTMGNRAGVTALGALISAMAIMAAPAAAHAAKLTKALKVNAQLFRNASFNVRVGMNEPVTRIKVQVKLSGTVAENVQLRLRSPAGRELLVHNRGGGK